MRVIQERTSNGVPTVAYTRGPDLSGTLEGAGGIGGLLARSEWNSVSSTWSHAFYHSDGVGNVTALAVPNGNDIALAGSYRYDPFGRLIGAPTGLAARNTQRFSSKDWHIKGSVLDIDRYIGQSHSPDMARKLRVEFAGAHHESW